MLAALLLLGGCLRVAEGSDPTPDARVRGERDPVRATSSAGVRPNLLVVMTDDMRYDDLRFMPSVRRLVQARGVTFRNSFSPYPLCCPARASFLTGELTHNHGVYSHEEPFGFGAFDDSETLATALHRVGYRTALVGRYLNHYGLAPSRVTGEPSISYVPPGWDEWMSAVETDLPPSDPLAGNTYYYRDMTQNVNGRVVPHEGQYGTDVIGRQARGVVQRFAQGRRPWLLHITTVAPHHGTPIEPDDPDAVHDVNGHEYQLVTPAVPDDLRDRFDEVIRRAPGVPEDGVSERALGDKPRSIRHLTPLVEEEREGLAEVTRQRAEALYAVDRQLEQVVRVLKRTGEWRDTMVVFTSDNGYFQGEHRIRQGKIRPHEPSLRVPLLVAGPGVPRGERFDPVTTVDLTATLLDVASARMRHPLDGTSFLPTLTGGDRGWRRPVPTEGMMGLATRDPSVADDFTDPRDVIGVRTGRWKFVRYADTDRELYDLLEDPNEMRNRAGDPRYARVERELDRVWHRLKDCRGADCLRPLPKDLRLSAARARAITDHQEAAVVDYYGPRPSLP